MSPKTTERARLFELLKATVRTGTITLASGRTTDFYLDGRLVTLDPEGLRLVCELALEELQGRCDAVGGPTSGADPMVVGVGLLAHERGKRFRLFFARKEAKGHGMQKRVEGPPLVEGDRVALLDDVATSGGSLLQAAEAIRQDTRARVELALVIVDREEGAREALAAEGIELITLFKKSDFIGS